MKPTVGRIVQYRLRSDQAFMINKRRNDFAQFRRSEGYQDTGSMAHFGNPATEGEVVPLLIVKVFTPGGAVNGQAFLDGNDTLWVTSVSEGIGPGTWSWPERV